MSIVSKLKLSFSFLVAERIYDFQQRRTTNTLATTAKIKHNALLRDVCFNSSNEASEFINRR